MEKELKVTQDRVFKRIFGKPGNEAITKDFLDKNNIPYNELIIGAKDKITVCQDKKIELFIEDSYETCRQLTDHGIKSILMTTKMNCEIDSQEIVRVNNWKEIQREVEKYREQQK